MKQQVIRLILEGTESEIKLADEEIYRNLAVEIISQIEHEQLNKLFKFDKQKIKEIESGDIVEFTAEINII